MPRREVVFTGLFAFGAGVVVGANWPKASNIVGYIMTRLGFELADLAVWAWDPEKTALLTQETQTALHPRSKKKAKVARIRANNSILEKNSAKTKKSAPSPRTRSKAIIIPATGRKGVNGHEAWIQDRKANSIVFRNNGISVGSPLSQSGLAGGRVTRIKSKTPQAKSLQPVEPRRRTVRTGLRTANPSSSRSDRATAQAARPKAKNSVPENARKAPTAQGRRKTNGSRSAARLEAAALN
jgi:hypothetical protein